jgi:outer membrane protein TolC
MNLTWEVGRRTDRAKHRQAENAVEARGIDVRLARRKKEREIRDLARRLEESLRVIALQEARLAVARQRVELYADRWENGEIDILEYIRSQNDFENTRIQLINQKTSYMDLLGEYDFTVGR